MPTEFNRVPTEVGNDLVLTNIRLAFSPHDAELKVEWEKTTGEKLGNDDQFYAIYLEGETDTPDPADPDTQSVRGYGVHVLRREGDPNAFTFIVNRDAPKIVYELTLKKDTKAFFFDTRIPATQTKVFAKSKPISEHAAILNGLKAESGPNKGKGTSTGKEEFGHPNGTKTILQISIS